MESSSSPFEVQLESKLHMKSNLEAQRAVQEGLESNLEAVLVVLNSLESLVPEDPAQHIV